MFRFMRISHCLFSFVLVGVTVTVLKSASLATAADQSICCLAALPDDQAWNRLPPLASGQRQPLPIWVRVLADSLPRTTAAMLELDSQHRAHGPLGQILAAKVRWTVAGANRCAYSAACAEVDLRRAGLRDPASAVPWKDLPEVSDEDRLVLAFARRLTLEADSITDDEVTRLNEILGERNLVALVLLVAHANFQDRLFLALQSVTDLGEPLPPLEVRFRQTGEDGPIAVPERIMPNPASAPPVPERVEDPQWQAIDFAALQRRLETQRQGSGRIRVPEWDEVKDTIPEDQRPDHPIRILWTRVCRGYQPELAAGWSACTRNFAEEAKQDRVFEESLFWVITRTLHCFY